MKLKETTNTNSAGNLSTELVGEELADRGNWKGIQRRTGRETGTDKSRNC